MKTKKARSKKNEMTAEDFIALPDDEKNRIFAELEAETAEERLAKSKPLNSRERAEWRRIQASMRRNNRKSKVGNGVQKVSVSIEQSLLAKVDAYAKSQKLKRSELFASGVATLIGAETKRI